MAVTIPVQFNIRTPILTSVGVSAVQRSGVWLGESDRPHAGSALVSV